jgi:hypothetical protein
MPIDPGLIGPTTIALSSAVSAFQTFLPSISDIRKKSPESDPEFAADVRMGEAAAIGITMGVGVILSNLTGSSAPAIVALLCSIGLIVLYETTLRTDKPMERTD